MKRSTLNKMASLWLLLSFICICFCTSATADGAGFWEMSRKSDYLNGWMDGLSVSDNGILRPSPTVTPLAEFSTATVILSSTLGKDGSLYFGTGHSGQVFTLKPNAKELQSIADFDEIDVTALACDSKNRIYAASSPDGRIYRITPEGKKEEFANPKEKYIWALLVLPDDSILVGTGIKGRVYRITQNGESGRILETDQSNVTSLLLRKDGLVWVGADPGGIILQVNVRPGAEYGRTLAIIDTPYHEIRRISQAADGTIFALGVGGDKGLDKSTLSDSTPESSLSAGSSSSETVIIASDVSASSASAVAKEKEIGGSILYRFRKDDAPEIIWTSTEAASSLLVLEDGCTLIGATRQGRIFKIYSDGRSDLFLQLREEQASFLLSNAGSIRILTNGTSAVFRVENTAQADGVFTSTVRDARFTVAAWGTLLWKGKGRISVQTRTGNTQTPNSTWNEWSSPILISGDKVKSPNARFLQWRITLRPGSELSYFRATYLPRNVAPSILSASVTPPGVALQDTVQPPPDPAIVNAGLDPSIFGFPPPQPPRKIFQRGARSVQWQAEDRNGDPLTYQISVRERGAESWRMIAENIRTSYFVISPDALPDGLYEFRIDVSDILGNPDSYALTSSYITDPITIDNTPPLISFRSGPVKQSDGNWLAAFSISDKEGGFIKTAEYSVDYSVWKFMYPQDRVLDGATEEFLLDIGKMVKGDHILSIRVMDGASNVASEKMFFRVE